MIKVLHLFSHYFILWQLDLSTLTTSLSVPTWPYIYIISHVSFTYKKVNKIDSFHPSGCNGTACSNVVVAVVHL